MPLTERHTRCMQHPGLRALLRATGRQGQAPQLQLACGLGQGEVVDVQVLKRNRDDKVEVK